MPPRGEEWCCERGYDDAACDEDRGGSGRRSVFRIGCGYQSWNSRRIASGCGCSDARNPFASSEPVCEGEEERGEDEHGDSKSKAGEARLPDEFEVEGGAQRECEEWNEHRRCLAEEFAKVGIEIAEEHAEGERQNGANQRLPWKGGQACYTQGDHGEEGARLKRHDGVGGCILCAAVLIHEGHVQSAVGVVDGGHDGES